ncbi:MAG: tRNA (cytidine(34)-2'-O)-methyltransferase (EC [uncultured Campylobacterales bacterium]|uniref:Putative tRNA (cytidine(34)-2'-O)-methyltransferase n=1 Tax=uncultured Campylobacterales bacterium TaxID=352960 RepID=A0A6S6SGT1_9BACT|nr:MAG: tRNA (cytidine(34)-2'-O)-methyltransferase (EC [uncultured Campylobacterales bacterium]
MFNVVLVSPQIPQNTGTIGRLCVNTNSKLHIVKPMCFEINDKNVKRAGLDYWDKLDIEIYENLDEFMSKHGENIDRFFFATTKSKKPYFKASFQKDDYLFFGSESHGLPMELMQKNFDNAITIPMSDNGRSLNISIATGIILYEGIRQTNGDSHIIS